MNYLFIIVLFGEGMQTCVSETLANLAKLISNR